MKRYVMYEKISEWEFSDVKQFYVIEPHVILRKMNGDGEKAYMIMKMMRSGRFVKELEEYNVFITEDEKVVNESIHYTRCFGVKLNELIVHCTTRELNQILDSQSFIIDYDEKKYMLIPYAFELKCM